MDWGIVYYKAADGTVPAEDYLDGLTTKSEAQFNAVLESVRDAPPPQFSGGGYWEAMHGSMNGYYEIRTTGPNRDQLRLFCILDNADADELERRGFKGPQIAVINGMTKKIGKKFSDREYKRHVRDLGDRYLATFPRRIAG